MVAGKQSRGNEGRKGWLERGDSQGGTNSTWFGVSYGCEESRQNIQISGYARPDDARARYRRK